LARYFLAGLRRGLLVGLPSCKGARVRATCANLTGSRPSTADSTNSPPAFTCGSDFHHAAHSSRSIEARHRPGSGIGSSNLRDQPLAVGIRYDQARAIFRIGRVALRGWDNAKPGYRCRSRSTQSSLAAPAIPPPAQSAAAPRSRPPPKSPVNRAAGNNFRNISLASATLSASALTGPHHRLR
jgi:hypothetical protein